jgi:glycosidase
MGRRYWPQYKGRDGERTPMQWNSGVNAGFTTGTPWLRIPASAKKVNVAVENNQPDSLLNYYRRLIGLRRSEPALVQGQWRPVNDNDTFVLSYLRATDNSSILVALNMSASEQHEHYSLGTDTAHLLVDSLDRQKDTIDLRDIHMEPFEALVVKFK